MKSTHNPRSFTQLIIVLAGMIAGCGEGSLIIQNNESQTGSEYLDEEDDVCPKECPSNCVNGACSSDNEAQTGSEGEEDDVCPKECPSNCVNGACSGDNESQTGSEGEEDDVCPEECLSNCVKGACSGDNEGQSGSEGEEDEVCPEECPSNCVNGACSSDEVSCPESCPDDCTDGHCNSDVTANCPDECPDDCAEGKCNEHQIKCPDKCPDACDENGICELECPEECPETCDENGKCPIICPESCTTQCDENGVCQCPASCTTSCDETGTCQCAPSCTTSCDENGVCQCPSTCKTSCDVNGVCECPSSCKSVCDENGVCQCPSTCKTSCDENGICQCPSTCANTCDANGVCPAMCGNEVIKSFKFGSAELDILIPSFSARTSTYSTLSIKTDKNTYDLSNAPCKDKIKLKSSNTKVITVSKNVGCKVTSVGVGTATCTATLEGTNLSASYKIHVLNPNRFKDNLAEKVDGKFTHVYSGILQLAVGTRVSQGFDFYNNDFMYFSQLKYNQKLTDGTTLSRNGAIIFQNKPQNNNSKNMTLLGSGHAQNLSIERTGGKDYVWAGNYGTLISGSETEGYKHSQTVSRIEYQPGKVFNPNEVEDHYAHSDSSSYYYNFEPALDQKNNKFGLKSIYKKDGLVHIKLYNLAKVKALTPKTVKLKKPIITVEKSRDNYKLTSSKTYSIQAKDLAALTPTNEFSIKSAEFPLQGWEVENGIIYAINGMPEDKVSGKYLYQSKIVLKLFTYNGKELATYYLRTSSANNNYLINKDMDPVIAHTKDGVDYYNVGYFEPEGIRVSDGKAYISVTTHLGSKQNGVASDSPRRQMIFVYDLMK